MRPGSAPDRWAGWQRATGAALGMLLACSEAPEAGPPPVPVPEPTGAADIPWPDLDALEPAVREQLAAVRAGLTEVLADPVRPAAERGEELGLSGNVYHAYGLLEAASACYRQAALLAGKDFRWPYFHGRLRQSQGQLAPAAGELQRAVELRPGFVPARVALAQVLADQGESAAAETEFRAALELDPGCAPAHVGLGRIEAERGGAGAAIHEFEEALRLDPSASSVHYELAMVHRKAGHADLAAQHLAQRGTEPAHLADPLMDGLAALKEGRRQKETLAARLVREGQYREAEPLLREVLAEDPENAVARTNLGVALLEQQRSLEALEEFAFLLRQDPRNSFANYNAAVLLARLGHEERAVGLFGRAVQERPDFRDAYWGLAQALRNVGRFPEAAAALERVLALDPGNGEAYYFLALTRARTGEWPEVRAVLERGLEALPDSTVLEHARIRVLAAAPADAIRDGAQALRRAQALVEKNATAERLETLAMALAETGEFEGAAAIQERILAAAARAGKGELEAPLQDNLEAYRAQRACRRPWPDALLNPAHTAPTAIPGELLARLPE